MSASKSDRSTSPVAVSEDSRRDLLARQHRALYGNESPAFFPPGALEESSRPASQAASTSGVRGASPRSVGGPFSLTGSTEAQTPPRANSTSSPSSAINAGFEQPVTSPSPDSSRQPTGTVGPIGSRVQNPPNPALNKRSITPLPSPLGLGFTPADPAPERTSSAGSTPAVPSTGSGPKDPAGVGLGWSNGSGVWGSKSGLGVQASVWG